MLREEESILNPNSTVVVIMLVVVHHSAERLWQRFNLTILTADYVHCSVVATSLCMDENIRFGHNNDDSAFFKLSFD